jgi:hypothetical protein
MAARGKVDLGPDGEALLKAMESSLKSSLDMQKRLAAVAARAADLEKKRADLRSQAPDAFRANPQTKRDEIIAELDASRFVVELVQAVETGGGTVVDPGGKLPRGKKGPFAGAPKGAGPVAAPPPRKKPKGGDDFEP